MNQNSDHLTVPGRFVRYRDVACRLQHMPGKWWISSDSPVDESFAKTGRRTFVRRLAHDAVLDCYDLSRPGTYRGMPVDVSSSEPRGYVVTARDPAFDDPQLRFTTEITPVPMPWKIAHDWERFTERLPDALRDVTDRVFLIVHAKADPRRYVQFAGAPGQLDAEAPATDVVPDADEFQLRRFDWAPPDVAQPNWTSSLRRPVVTAELMRLARRCTAALHEAYGVISPDELTYRAWREPAGAPAVAVEFPALGLA